jgi:hypothetical protein
MTPKEKAKELVEKYAIWSWNEAKQCALIAVDEVLNFIHTDAFSYTNEEYWQQVKQEIDKL